jgi:Uma2 family endonuclease
LATHEHWSVMTTKVHPLMTIADWEAMPDDGNRYEIIEGELFVSCSPGLTHQMVLDNLIFIMKGFLEANPIGMVVSTPGLILSNYSGVIPDLVFFRHERRDEIVTGERLTGPPDLVIEILSPGSENKRRDRVAKLQLYSKHKVPEYWILDPEKLVLEKYRLGGNFLSLMETLQYDEVLSTQELSGFSCKISQIFKQF